MLTTIAVILSLTLGTYCCWSFVKNERFRRRYEDMPTTKTAGVFIGEVELKGTAETSGPLTAPLSRREAVWYDWYVEEQWQRTEREKVSPERAKEIGSEYEEKVVNGWNRIAGSTSSSLFYLKDETGHVRIDPQKARVEPVQAVYKTCRSSDPFYFHNAPREAIADSTGDRRFTEAIIPVGAPLFISGHSRIRDDAVAAEVAWDADHPDYLISTNPEEKIIKGVKASSVGSRVIFVLLSAFIFYAFFREWVPALIGGAVGLTALVPAWIWVVHQSMVKLKNRSAQAASNVDVELKRRHTLIPQLIEAVRGFKEYEADLQPALTELRSQERIREVGDAREEGVLVPVARQIMAVVERYPALKSSALFLNLQKNLAETEDRIALARQYYNDTVEYVNSRRESFPEGLVARLSGVRKLDYFHAEAFERPSVQIGLE